MTRALWSAAAVVLLVPLSIVPADAMCASPRTVVLPESGATLPTTATLYCFRPRAAPALLVTGQAGRKALAVDIAELSRTAAFTAYRLRFTARPGTEVELKLDQSSGEPEVRRYRIDAGWRRPWTTEVLIPRVTSEELSWACSHQSTQNLTLSGRAPAYRVEWAETEPDYHAGRRQHIVVPNRIDHFFSWPDGSPVPAGSQVQLGHVRCLGATFAWTSKSVWLGVTALYEDGREGDAPRQPVYVRRPPGPGLLKSLFR